MNTKNIKRYIEIGKRDINWYADCQKMFEELFGADRLELICSLFAATSINTSLKSNITLFRKALYEIENDLPVGRYLPNIQNQLYRVRCGDELSGRKIRSFARAMSGDANAVVVDVWLLRAFELESQYFRQKKGAEKGRGLMRSNGAGDKKYAKIENWVRRYARRHGYEARQVSAMIWSGIRVDKTGDTDTQYHRMLKNKLVNLFNVI